MPMGRKVLLVEMRISCVAKSNFLQNVPGCDNDAHIAHPETWMPQVNSIRVREIVVLTNRDIEMLCERLNTFTEERFLSEEYSIPRESEFL